MQLSLGPWPLQLEPLPHQYSQIFTATPAAWCIWCDCCILTVWCPCHHADTIPIWKEAWPPLEIQLETSIEPDVVLKLFCQFSEADHASRKCFPMPHHTTCMLELNNQRKKLSFCVWLLSHQLCDPPLDLFKLLCWKTQCAWFRVQLDSQKGKSARWTFNLVVRNRDS